MLAGNVRPGNTVAVVGAGAVGLAAVLTTGLWGAARVIAIDSNKFRLTKALEFGATDAVEVGPGTVADVLALTDGLGVDVAIEAVGYPQTPQTAAALVRPGGTIANRWGPTPSVSTRSSRPTRCSATRPRTRHSRS